MNRKRIGNESGTEAKRIGRDLEVILERLTSDKHLTTQERPNTRERRISRTVMKQINENMHGSFVSIVSFDCPYMVDACS